MVMVMVKSWKLTRKFFQKFGEGQAISKFENLALSELQLVIALLISKYLTCQLCAGRGWD